MNEGNEMFEISLYAKEWTRNCSGIVIGGGGGESRIIGVRSPPRFYSLRREKPAYDVSGGTSGLR